MEPTARGRRLQDVGVAVGSALVDCHSQRRIAVPLVNLGDDAQLIRSGTTIALAQPSERHQDCRMDDWEDKPLPAPSAARVAPTVHATHPDPVPAGRRNPLPEADPAHL